MKFHSHIQSPIIRRLLAVLAIGAVLAATFPSRADDELLALAYPRELGRSALGNGSEIGQTLAPEVDPAESPTTTLETTVPLVHVRLQAINNSDVMTMALPLDGRLAPSEAEKVAHFFRCRRTGRQHAIAPGVLAMLAGVGAHWPDRSIQIVSGFRAPPFGVPHSKHFKGRAIDLRVSGVRTTKLRDFVWRENRGGVGVGYYERENFVHMDWRAGEQDQAWTASEEGSGESYNPPWARKARRVLPSQARKLQGPTAPVATTPTVPAAPSSLAGA